MSVTGPRGATGAGAVEPRPPSPDELLAALDAEQRTVARTLLGPVAVLAGAGTGKTRAITHRIAYGVASGVFNPTQVLAVTFTTRAAGELRTRLRELGAQGVQARTFHSAALRQARYFWPKVYGGELPSLLDSKLGLVAAVLYHALNGVRVMLVDFWAKGPRYQRQMLWAILGIWVVVMVPAAVRMLMHTFAGWE